MRGHIGFKIPKQLPPGAPMSVTAAADVQTRTVTLTWTAPTTGNTSSIIDYVVQYSTNSGASWNTHVHPAYATPQELTFTTFPINTFIVFRVAAVNPFGIGPYTLSNTVIMIVSPTPDYIAVDCVDVGGLLVPGQTPIRLDAVATFSDVFGEFDVSQIEFDIHGYSAIDPTNVQIIVPTNGVYFGADIPVNNVISGPCYRARARYLGTAPSGIGWVGPWSQEFETCANVFDLCPPTIYDSGDLHDQTEDRAVHFIAIVPPLVSSAQEVTLCYEITKANYDYLDNASLAAYDNIPFTPTVFQKSTDNGLTWTDAEATIMVTGIPADLVGVYAAPVVPGETYLFRMMLSRLCEARCHITEPLYIGNNYAISVSEPTAEEPDLGLGPLPQIKDISVDAETSDNAELTYQWQYFVKADNNYYYNNIQDRDEWLDLVDNWDGDPSTIVTLEANEMGVHNAQTATLRIKPKNSSMSQQLKFRVLVRRGGSGRYSPEITLNIAPNVYSFAARPARMPPGAVQALPTAKSTLPQVIYAQPQTHDTGVVLSFFSPCDYALPKAHFKRVVSDLSAAGIPFAVTQVVRTDQQPLPVPEGVPSRVFVSDDTLFYKENLWNLGAALLPHNKLVFMDADIEYDAPNWVDRISEALNDVDILQPFGLGLWLDRNRDICFERMSAAAFLSAGAQRLSSVASCHPGFAWAMTRKTFDAIGGFYVRQPLGNCDTAFSAALAPGDLKTVAKAFNTVVRRTFFSSPSYAEYRKRVQALKLRVGCLATVNALHYWHGNLEDRRYLERDQTYLAACRVAGEDEYPLYFREDGLMQWSNPEASAKAREYFLLRKEDG